MDEMLKLKNHLLCSFFIIFCLISCGKMSETASESTAVDTKSVASPEYPTESSKDTTVIREPASIDPTEGVGQEVTFGENDIDPKEVDV